jgi:SAM-dependent methyltransferase
MSDSLPLTKAGLASLASDFLNAERLVELELSGLDQDSLYELVFSRLTKPDPVRQFGVETGPDTPYMLGTDQRDYLVPLLSGRLAALRPGATILDVGSGAGQTTAASLLDRIQPLSLIPLDPAEGALRLYEHLFASQFPQITVPRTIAAGIDDMLAASPGSAAAVDETLDMILAIHALYFTGERAGFLRFAHERLAPGGKVLIAYGGHGDGYPARLARDYWGQYAKDDDAIGHFSTGALETFFGISDVAAGVEACEAVLRERLGGDLFHVAAVIHHPTRLFAHDLGDLIVIGFLTGLVPRDANELRRQIRYVSDRLRKEPETFDLRLTLRGPRARMLSVAQPQVFIELEKR